MKHIENICEKYDLKLIEDAAEMIGQTCHNLKCGSFGDLSTFSFYANKHITTGEGGFLGFKDVDLANKAKLIRDHGILFW